MDVELKTKKAMSKAEVMLLMDLIQNNPILTSKETNAATNKIKEDTWASLACAFNARSGTIPRTKQQLKLKWDNLKKSARKKKRNEDDGRRERNLAIAEYYNAKTRKLNIEIELLEMAKKANQVRASDETTH